ncbi:protein FimG-like protein [Escherichia coli]|nr:protein FimG-like protein [Escherichia coli]SQM26196.1 protein FimG-like protein [Escherichia coli]
MSEDEIKNIAINEAFSEIDKKSGETVTLTPNTNNTVGFAPIFPDICYHLTHYKPAAADIPVASDNPAHYADAIRYNARTPLQGSSIGIKTPKRVKKHHKTDVSSTPLLLHMNGTDD